MKKPKHTRHWSWRLLDRIIDSSLLSMVEEKVIGEINPEVIYTHLTPQQLDVLDVAKAIATGTPIPPKREEPEKEIKDTLDL